MNACFVYFFVLSIVSPGFDPQIDEEDTEEEDRDDKQSRNQLEIHLGDPSQVTLTFGVFRDANLDQYYQQFIAIECRALAASSEKYFRRSNTIFY